MYKVTVTLSGGEEVKFFVNVNSAYEALRMVSENLERHLKNLGENVAFMNMEVEWIEGKVL